MGWIRLRQRTLLTILVLFLVVLALPRPISGSPFIDLQAHQCEVAVARLHYVGLVAGYEDGAFYPERTITRAELAKIVSRCLNQDKATSNPTFRDVPDSHWARQYVTAVTQASIMRGYPEGDFRPDSHATYAELLTTLLRLCGHSPVDALWPSNYLVLAEHLGLLADLPVEPSQPALRGNSAIIIERILFDVDSPTSGHPVGLRWGVSRTSVLHLIDVGQGDAILVVTRAGNALLVDAGPSAAGPSIVQFLDARGIDRISAAVLSHAHEDHIGGMYEVLESYPIGRVYDSGYEYESSTYRGLLQFASSVGVQIEKVSGGEEILVDPWVNVRVLAPTRLTSDCNENSLVLKVTFDAVSVVLTGDAGTASESQMLMRPWLLSADILKVGHHGSNSSTSSAFLSAVSPTTALISVGAGNPYGHPHAAVLERLEAAGTEIWRTDLHGSMSVTTDGSTWTIIGSAANPGTFGPVQPTPGYIGNRNTRKFHLPSCLSLPALENRVYFQTREDAVSAGYVACGRCNP